MVQMAKNKDLVFIFEETNADKLLQSIKNEKIVICGNDIIKSKISKLGYSCKSITEYSDDPYCDIKHSIDWIKNWPDKPILNGKSLKKLLVYNDISIYWFLETRFFVYRIQTLIPLIEQVRRILSSEKPNKIWINGNIDVKHIANELCDNEVPIKFFQETPKTNVSYKSYSGFPILKLLLLKLLRGLSLFLSKPKKLTNPVLVLTEVNNWRDDYYHNTKKYIKKDVTFHKIIQKLLKKSIPVTIIDFENQPRRLFNAYSLNKKRNKSYGVTVEPWEKYITFNIIRKSIQFNKQLKKISNALKHSTEFKNSLVYDNISLYKILKNDIEDLFKSFKTFTAVTFIETSKRILEIKKPSTILMHDEYGTIQLCFINQAKKQNIPTLAIQHGVNTETGVSYVHKPEHVDGIDKRLNFPLPDKMCVWSELSKNNLIKFGNFPESIPFVTGDPKVDFLPEVIEKFNAIEIKKNLKIPKEKKNILFATQPLPLIEEKKLITRNVMNSVKKLQNCFLIIKMHPRESDFSFYQKLANESKIIDYLLVRFHNLYELLSIADTVIVPFSTVGVEAMRMEKPVIAMNLLGLHDADPLIKSNVALVVKTETELIPTIKKCLDEQNMHEIIESGRVFAQKELGIADGSSSERIVNLLLELIKKPKIDK